MFVIIKPNIYNIFNYIFDAIYMNHIVINKVDLIIENKLDNSSIN
jgi:hypothetical protein